MRDLHPALLALMEHQGGVFSAAQARAHGHDVDHLNRLRTRRPRVLTSVRRGVYAWREAYESAPPDARHLLDVAALGLSLEGNAVVSHQSAAVVLGLELLDPDLDCVHVTRQPPCRPHVEAGVQHHVAELPDELVLPRAVGLPVTCPARTAIDVARGTGRLECAVAACDSALRSGVPRDELAAVFDPCRSWPGAHLVARAIELADARAANPGESWSRVVLISEGLAPDELQVPVYDEEGLVGYADFGWDGVVGEFDGKGKYGLVQPVVDAEAVRRVLWNEKRREDRLRVRHEVVRWSTADLHQPGVLAGRVRAAQERARLRAGGWRASG